MRQIPTEDLLKDLKRVCNSFGRGVTTAEYDEHGEHFHRTITRRLDSWYEAVELVGYERAERIPKDELIEDIQRVAELTEGTPTWNEYREMTEFSESPIRRKFGGWNEAVKAAGLEPNRLSPGNSDPGEEKLWQLRWKEAMTYDEMAEELGINNNTVIKWCEEYELGGNVPKLVRFLLTNGPTPKEEVKGTISKKGKDLGASSFRIDKGGGITGPMVNIYYLAYDHDIRRVVEVALEEVGEALAEMPRGVRTHVFSVHGSQWRKAFNEVRTEYDL